MSEKRSSKRLVNLMAKKDEKEMSEEKVEAENVIVSDGLITYTLKAVHGDYDLVVRMRRDAVEGADAVSLLRMAERTYKHMLSNEAAAQNGNAREKDDYPGEETFLRTWRSRKRQDIIEGKIGFRQVGPRISPLEKEHLRLIDVMLAEKLAKAGITPFPTSGKAMIQGKTLNDWRQAYKDSPKWAHLAVEAKANVDAASARIAAAKAAGETVDLSADL